jgi:guanosine-3',5'-bis(diphosphate) 3'-pyrophosphohydrolase
MSTNEHLNHAIIIATEAHKNQVDRGGQPYIFHPLRVMLSVDRLDEKIVAVLHDMVEDTDTTLEDLGKYFDKEIIEAVDAISRRKDKETYKEFIRRVYMNPIARKVKIADIKDNLNLNRPGSLEFLSKGICQRYYEALLFLED